MPQLAQLPEVFWSQLFWLVIVFGITFFAIGRGMVPRIQRTVETRQSRIADDLAAAEAARADAEAKEETWRERLNEARAEAARVTQAAKEESARDVEARLRKATDKIGSKVDRAEAEIARSVTSAQSVIEGVAAEITQDLVDRLIGAKVDKKEAAVAVKAELNV